MYGHLIYVGEKIYFIIYLNLRACVNLWEKVPSHPCSFFTYHAPARCPYLDKRVECGSARGCDKKALKFNQKSSFYDSLEGICSKFY